MRRINMRDKIGMVGKKTDAGKKLWEKADLEVLLKRFSSSSLFIGWFRTRE